MQTNPSVHYTERDVALRTFDGTNPITSKIACDGLSGAMWWVHCLDPVWPLQQSVHAYE